MNIEELQHAIEVLEHGRQTHVEWIEYLKETPDVDTELVGDIEHHEWYLTGYDPAIRALRLVANLNIEAMYDTLKPVITTDGDRWDASGYGTWVDAMRAGLAAAFTPGDTHKHKWIEVTNAVVDSGPFCEDCGEIKATPQGDTPQ